MTSAAPRGGRRTVAVRAFLVHLAIAAATPALAQDEALLEARFEAPPVELAVGARETLVLVVDAAPSARWPLLVTPSSDGPAVEVVHGRLFRADAEEPSAFPLRFRVPVHAASAGDAVVRARVEGYACEGERCRPVEAEASVPLRVRP